MYFCTVAFVCIHHQSTFYVQWGSCVWQRQLMTDPVMACDQRTIGLHLQFELLRYSKINLIFTSLFLSMLHLYLAARIPLVVWVHTWNVSSFHTCSIVQSSLKISNDFTFSHVHPVTKSNPHVSFILIRCSPTPIHFENACLRMKLKSITKRFGFVHFTLFSIALFTRGIHIRGKNV